MKLQYIDIYDYAGGSSKVYLPDKEIAEIHVKVLSGDETGYVKFEDGTLVSFDACSTRRVNYYDGEYTVFPEQIRRWEKSAFNDVPFMLDPQRSYKRMLAFVDLGGRH